MNPRRPARSIRLLLVCREYPPTGRHGGIASYNRDVAEDLVRRGAHVCVLAAADVPKPASFEIVNGVRVTRLAGGDFFVGERPGLPSRLRSLWREWTRHDAYRRALARQTRALVAREKIDIVEFADYGDEAKHWAMMPFTVPWVVRLHGPSILDRRTGILRPTWHRPLATVRGMREMRTVERATWITAPSHAMLARATEYAPRIVSRSCVIPNGIRVENWVEGPIPARGTRSPLRLLFVGSIVAEKGCLELVKAAQVLLAKGREVRLTFAGKLGNAGRRIRALSRRPDGAWITLAGQLPREALRPLYAASDIVVLPSWWESFGLTCIEAMATGAIVIGSRAGGMGEIIRDGENGFLCNPRDVPGLVAQIERVACLPEELTHSIRLEARRTVVGTFGLDVTVPRLLELYRSLLASSGREPCGR